MELAYEHMNNPQEIKIDADTRVADKISQYSYYPADEEKSTLLINLLHRDNPERVLVFANTRHSVDEISRTLTANSISNAALSGDVPQRKRESLLEGFKTGKYKVLVATDVAARGLHIPSVSHVFNYDLPQDADDYVHRIGRTARAGQSGEAISFICEKYAYSIMEIEDYIGHTIDKRDIDPGLLVPIEIAARQRRSKKVSKERATGKSTNRKVRTKPASESIATSAGNHTQQTATQPELEQKPPLDTANADLRIEIPLENEGPALNQTNQEDRPAPATDFTVTDDEHVAIPMPEVQSVEETSSAPPAPAPEVEATVQEETRLRNIPDSQAVPSLPKPRFSRRFGEIPLIG
jgi:superfamily II DNA/RNA helicase